MIPLFVGEIKENKADGASRFHISCNGFFAEMVGTMAGFARLFGLAVQITTALRCLSGGFVVVFIRISIRLINSFTRLHT
jgi:hypothetical protein